MKRQLFLLTLLAGVMTLQAADGDLIGRFSINAEGDQVVFSQGNLQYQASTDTWRFAPNQYNICGNYNYYISSDNPGWIDLFGWGTGSNPTNISTEESAYSTFIDWGTNAISNGGKEANLWRTLTSDEWKYVLQERTNAATLFGLGSVDSVNGIILLPDNWMLPAGASFTAGSSDESYYDFYDNFSNNTYTAAQWAVMESAGAVFLPTTGWRRKQGVFYCFDSDGFYWSSTLYSMHLCASGFWFEHSARSNGYAVRLVKDYEEEKTLTGKFSVSADEQVFFSQGNLRYQASSGTWRFAENQYDIVGEDNANISATYTGWIDLFGWGTSGFLNKYPWMTSTDEYDYTDGTTNDIADTYFDWGKYNAIVNGGQKDGIWRTMTIDEWDYLLKTRPDATLLQGAATVASNRGYVLLPDAWTLPDRMWFTPMAGNFNVNTYTLQQWKSMEETGAVFLPMTGYRSETEPDDIDRCGLYWTSTSDPSDVMMAAVASFCIGETIVLNTDYNDRTSGCAVRLVRNADNMTGIDDIPGDKAQSTKLLRDGQLIIRHGDKEYNAQGQLVK